ncbi:MAG TPA: MMPL family transporter [Parvibaculum sp.]|jgi:predicted exporter
MTRKHLSASLALVLFIVAGVFVATHIRGAIDTDILSLLPGDAQDPVLADALHRASAAASDRVAFAIEGGTPEARRTAAGDLTKRLVATGLFQPSSADAESLWKWIFAHRATLLCAKDRARLEAGQGAAIAQESLLQWYAPMGIGGSRLLDADPLLLTNRLLGCLVPSNVRLMPDPSAEIVSGSIGVSAYRLDVQDRIGAVLQDWRARTAREGLTLSRAGAVFHAAYGAEQARKEMSVIGSIATAAVLLLYWLMFRSLRAPLIAVTMVLYSLTIGLALTLLIFGSVHAMGLVFGAALIGMVVDYTTYYLVTGLGDEKRTREERATHIMKPLTLGMLTSVGAFAALLFFPVPAFRQIAIFGGAGLAAAWFATFSLTPLFEGGAMRKGPGATWIEQTAGRFLSRSPRPRTAWFVLAVGVVLGAASIMGDTIDNVRSFQAPSPQLAREEARIKALTGFATSGSFFLVRGASSEDAISNEERLLATLEREGAVENVLWAASRLDPSMASKGGDVHLIDGRLLPLLPKFVEQLGAGNAKAYAMPVKAVPLPSFAASLRGQTRGIHWSIVPVIGNPGIGKRTLASEGSWQFVDPAQRYSDLLGKYRRLATYGLVGAVLSTGLMLLVVYRQLSALKIILPTVIALIATPAVTMLLGLPFSFFSAMGLFLVVGAGVDYAIFQWEHPREGGTWTRVGIVLAALMTCISVGLLGLSSVLPVKSFGLTVAIGILLSLVLSPLVRGWRYGASSGEDHER